MIVVEEHVHNRHWSTHFETLKAAPGQWFAFVLPRTTKRSLAHGRTFYHVRRSVETNGEDPDDYQWAARNLPMVDGETEGIAVLFGRYVGGEYRAELEPPLEYGPEDEWEDYPYEGVFEPDAENENPSDQETVLVNLALAVSELRRELRDLKEGQNAR